MKSAEVGGSRAAGRDNQGTSPCRARVTQAGAIGKDTGRVHGDCINEIMSVGEGVSFLRSGSGGSAAVLRAGGFLAFGIRRPEGLELKDSLTKRELVESAKDAACAHEFAELPYSVIKCENEGTLVEELGVRLGKPHNEERVTTAGELGDESGVNEGRMVIVVVDGKIGDKRVDGRAGGGIVDVEDGV